MLQEGKKIQWFLYYFHRVWRILPLYSFLLFLYGTLSPVLSNGPAWFAYKHEVARTLPYFWTNLLFINNFYPAPELQVRLLILLLCPHLFCITPFPFSLLSLVAMPSCPLSFLLDTSLPLSLSCLF